MLWTGCSRCHGIEAGDPRPAPGFELGPIDRKGPLELADSGVDTAEEQLDSLAVTKDKINNGAVGLKKLAQDGAAVGQIIKWDGAEWVIANDSVGVDDDEIRTGNAMILAP